MKILRPKRNIPAATGLLICIALALVPVAVAASQTNPHTSVTGAVYTSTDPAVDGTGRCQNGNPHLTTPTIDCNIYTGKEFVWLNGGPPKKPLGPAGQYFFAVLDPGDQSNANDPTSTTANPHNLSCPTVGCSDPRSNRTFTVGASGEVTSYTGTHQQDATTYPDNGIMIRLCAGSGPFCPPYIDTPNPGGEYVMAVCYLGPAAGPLATTVTPDSCKYDNFKVKNSVNSTPPECQLTKTGTDASGFKYIKVTIGSASGLDSIDVTRHDNLTYSISPTFHKDDTGTWTVMATRVVKTKKAHLTMTLTDINGNVTKCDPVMATLRSTTTTSKHPSRFTGLLQTESKVRIANGAIGLREVDVTVNGRTYRIRGLKARESRMIDVHAAMKSGAHNVMIVRGLGRAGGHADILISD